MLHVHYRTQPEFQVYNHTSPPLRQLVMEDTQLFNTVYENHTFYI